MAEVERPNRLIEEVLLTHGRLIAARKGVLGDPRITGAQSFVLTAIISAAEPQTVPRIGRSLGYTRQAIQRLVDGLVELGYVEFQDNPHHRRAKLLVATAAGRKLHADAKAARESWNSSMTRGIPTADLHKAAEVLRQIRHTLEADLKAREE